MFSIVLSSLALAAAVGCFAVTLLERKRSRERDATDLEHAAKAGEMLRERFKKQHAEWESLARKLEDRIEALENGTVPDHEKAKEAARAMDDFHQGLANILNFDPYEIIRQQREEGEGKWRK